MQFAHALIAAITLATCSPGFAEERVTGKAQAAAATASGIDQGALDQLVGQWRVEATDPATGKTETIRYEVRRFAGQAWLSGAGQSDDPGFESRDVWGYDPITKEVIRMVFVGSGTYAIVRSPGWKDGTLVLEGDARSADGIVRVRETIKWVSRDEFHATWEAMRDGAWSAYSIERVRRQR